MSKGQKSHAPRGQVRLQKALAAAGVASRRAAERMIGEGRVSVNGKIVREQGTKVTPKDVLRVDGRRVEQKHRRRYLVLNKPAGVVSTMSDPEGRKTVGDLIPERFGRLFPVGRLDLNSEGVLIFTDDGDLANRLMHPRHKVPRQYAVKVRGVVEPNDERLDTMTEGVTLEDGDRVRAVRAKVHRSTDRNSWLEITLEEGKNREVRRMCTALDLEVARLQRRSFGNIEVVGLKPGAWRELTTDELRKLRKQIVDE